MTRLILKDELLDAQLLRVAGSSIYGGADIGECVEAARRIKGTSLDSWYACWRELALRVAELARGEQEAGRTENARLAWLRACNYHRNAGVMLMTKPIDPRLIAANREQTEAFRAAAGLMESPPDVLEIPYEDSTLPGYFFRASTEPDRRATVILVGGYDGSAEELYFFNGAAALARGYNVLSFDGPGQGAALIQRGMTMRADWEHVIAPVVDCAVSRPDVDPGRIALIGLSLGAHLAPRAASGEHRLAACIADCGAYDLYEAALQRMPTRLANGVRAGERWARTSIGIVLGALARKPTAGWALRRGMLVHGRDTPLAYLDSLREFTLVGRAKQIQCPTWVCNAEGDDIGASAPQLVADLTCENEYVRFTAAEGAGDHCEQAARSLYHARSFGWLDSLLRPQQIETP